MSNVSAAKVLDILLPIVLKRCATTANKKATLLKNVRSGHQGKNATVFTASAGSSTSVVSMDKNLPNFVPMLTPEMVQEMIVSTFSALGLSGNAFLPSSPWYFDSGASNHMTNNVAALKNVTNYCGDLKIHTADGNSLPITAISDISSSLTNAYVSPGLTSNLISVGQLVDNGCKVEFSNSGCFVQESHSGKMIAKGPKAGRLFPLGSLLSSCSLLPFISCNSAIVSFQLWHKRLGHPNSNVLHDLIKSGVPGNKHFPSLSAVQFDCNSCKLGKSKILPFPIHQSN